MYDGNHYTFGSNVFEAKENIWTDNIAVLRNIVDTRLQMSLGLSLMYKYPEPYVVELIRPRVRWVAF